MRNKRIPNAALVMGLILIGYSAERTKTLSVESKTPQLRPMVVPGAMPVEAEKLEGGLPTFPMSQVAMRYMFAHTRRLDPAFRFPREVVASRHGPETVESSSSATETKCWSLT